MKINIIRFIKLVSFIIFICYPFNSHGDEFHFDSIRVGERAAALGGAYAALSEDTAGLFYNPAGIAFGANEVSASLNLYVGSVTTYEKVMGDSEWSSKSGELVPGILGGTYALSDKKGTLGFSVVVTDSDLIEQDEKIENLESDGIVWFHDGSIHHKLEHRIYNVGPSYAKKISDKLSFGATLYAHWKKKRDVLNQKFRYDYSDGSYELNATNVNIDETEWGIKPILGMTWRPDGKLSVGFSLSHVFVFKRDYKYEFIKVEYEGDELDENAFKSYDFSEESDTNREYPYVFRFGMAYTFSPAFLITGDVAFYTGTDRKDSNSTPSTFHTRSFMNTAIGAEYHLSDDWILRAGFFTNLANTDMENVRFDERREAIDMYGGSLGVTFKKDKYIISLGTTYSTGTGDARVGDFGFGDMLGSDEPVDAERKVWNILLSIAK